MKVALINSVLQLHFILKIWMWRCLFGLLSTASLASLLVATTISMESLAKESSCEALIAKSETRRSQASRPKLEAVVKDLEIVLNNIQIRKRLHRGDLQVSQGVHWPKSRFKWLQDFESSVINEIDSLSQRDRLHLKNLLPEPIIEIEHDDHFDASEMALIFALHLDPHRERVLQSMFGKDGNFHHVSRQIFKLTEMARNYTFGEYWRLFGPLLNNYYNQNKKEDSFSQELPRRRASDEIISVYANRAFESHRRLAGGGYAAYLRIVRRVIKSFGGSPPPGSSRNRRLNSPDVLLAFYRAIRSNLPENSSIQVLIMGSFVNGRATRLSDIDFGIYDDGSRRIKEGLSSSGRVSLVTEASIMTFGESFTLSDLTFDLEPSRLIELGLELNSVVVEIRSSGILLHTRMGVLHLE